MTSQSTFKKLYGGKDNPNLKEFTSQIWVVEKGSTLKNLAQFLDQRTQKKVSNFLKIRKFKFKSNSHICFDLSSKQKFSVLVIPSRLSSFSSLELAREVLSASKTEEAGSALIHLSAVSESQELCLIDSFVSAAVALNYQAPKYETLTKKKNPKQGALTVSFKVNHSRLATLQKQGQASEASAQKTNLVRNLAQRAGNDLTPSVYIKTATEMAEKAGLKTEFLSIPELKKLKAGAFLAVAQGAPESSGGILKLSYQPKKGKRKIALVGKGITFDTGGNNLKTGSHMFGMNNDMAGSAVVLALCLLAAQEQWPFQITGYMAITENILSGKAYRPNDVVTSLKGKTIEVIDTDAEGRMILADTLTLASKEKPDLVIDFATLTGSVIRALGTQYSGGYSNRKHWLSKIRKAGILSGERVWSFPNDTDYGRCLKSDIADIKQCRLTGGVDHIEAAFFLSQFVEKGVEWVHIDLGAMDPEEPLAHIPKKPSGFGVRVGKELIHMA